MLLDWARCVAAGNLCLVRVWTDLLSVSPRRLITEYGPPAAHDYAAAIALALLAGTALFAVFRLARGWTLPAAAAVATTAVAGKELLMVMSGLGAFDRGSVLFWLTGLDRGWLAAVGAGAVAVLAAGTIGVARNHGVRVFRFAASAAIPIALMVFLTAAMRIPSAGNPGPRAFEKSVGNAPAARRLVWILFDSMDEEVAFSKRSPELRLPALDRFRKEAAFVALEARSPADATIDSIPSLLRGRASRLSGLEAGTDTAIGRARQAGLRVGIAGWFLPYCRVFGEVADACAWWPMARQLNSFGTDFGSTLGGQLRSLFETNTFSPFGPSLTVRHHIETIEELSAAATAMAARPDLDFVFLHINVPHTPFVYDPETLSLGAARLRPRDYESNLRLADRIFERMRAAMEGAGVWERSAVLISSDHGYRSRHLIGYARDNRRVPFMLKTSARVTLDPRKPFDTLDSAGLLFENVFGVPFNAAETALPAAPGSGPATTGGQ